MSYTAIASQTLTSSVTSVTFSSIPGAFRDLVLVFAGKGTAGFVVRLNGDTGANYSDVNMHSNGSSTQSTSQTGATFFWAANSSLDNPLDGTNQASAILDFNDYSVTNKHKPILCRINRGNGLAVATAGRWANTAAINSIEIRTNFVAGDTFSLYGISA